jgi:hypothetical protein
MGDKELPVEIPPGDLGLGLCYGCVKRLVFELRDGKPPKERTPPRWAITWAPGPFNPPGAPVGVYELVAVPTCLQCLTIDRRDGDGHDGRPYPPKPEGYGRPYMAAATPPPGKLIRPS